MNPNQRSTAEQVLVAFGGVLLAVAVGAFLLWNRFHIQITTAVLATQHAQLMLIAPFSKAYGLLDADVMRADPSMVRPKALWVLCSEVGRVTRYPIGVTLLLLAVLCFRRASSGRFTRRLDIDALAEVLAKAFPVSKAYLGRGLELIEPVAGKPRPLDPALTPREWVDRLTLSANGCFDEGAMVAALQEQLGAPWKGLASAPAHVQCLAVAFWLHGRAERAEALEVTSGLALATQGLGMGKTGPETHVALPKAFAAQMRDYMAGRRELKEIEETAKQHTYTASVLMSLLMHARREAGVFNPGLFVALRLIDRPLWLAIHALGFPQERGPLWEAMPAPCIEAAGAIEHWRDECIAGRPLAVPSFTATLARIRVLIDQDTIP